VPGRSIEKPWNEWLRFGPRSTISSIRFMVHGARGLICVENRFGPDRLCAQRFFPHWLTFPRIVGWLALAGPKSLEQTGTPSSASRCAFFLGNDFFPRGPNSGWGRGGSICPLDFDYPRGE